MNCKVLCIGEVLWDIIRGTEHIGGAPFNLAAHLARLGCAASVLTRVGTDPRGAAAIAAMQELGVDTSLVQSDARHPTGWAKVELTGDGIPTFTFPDDPAYNFIEADDGTSTRLAAEPWDAICFGTLQQKGPQSRESLIRVLRSVPARHILYDVNIRLDFYPPDILRQSLGFSTVVKLNADEAPLVARRLYGDSLTEAELAKRLAGDFPVRVLCVTKGADGCTVYSGDVARSYACEPVRVADTVGAGDAFSAAFLEHYCRTGDPFASANAATCWAPTSLRSLVPCPNTTHISANACPSNSRQGAFTMRSAFAMFAAIVALSWGSTLAQAAAPDIVLADFEGKDYGALEDHRRSVRAGPGTGHTAAPDGSQRLPRPRTGQQFPRGRQIHRHAHVAGIQDRAEVHHLPDRRRRP